MDRPITNDLILAGNQRSEERDYWLSWQKAHQLSKVPFSDLSPREFSFDKADPSELHATLPASLTQMFQSVSAGRKSNLYALFLSCLALVLIKQFKLQRLTLGCPVTDSTDSSVSEMINLAVPLELAFDGSARCSEFFQQAQSTHLAAIRNQNWPSELLKPRNEVTNKPESLFNVVCALKGLHRQNFFVSEGPDLYIEFEHANGQIKIRFNYRSTVVPSAYVNRLLCAFVELSERALSEKGRIRIDDIDLESESLVSELVTSDPSSETATSDVRSSSKSRQQHYSTIRELMKSTWLDSLRMDSIAGDDNYFEVGGDSYSAIKLIASLRQAYGIDLTIRDLFTWPTIDGFATAICDGRAPQKADEERGAVKWNITRDRDDSGLLTVVDEDLGKLITEGIIEPVEAVTIGYINRSWVSEFGISASDLRHQIFDNRPQLTQIRGVGGVRMGGITLPLFDDELAADAIVTRNYVLKSVSIAKSIGASTVALAGTLPSVLDYGHALPAHLHENLKITTGHETTTCAVLLSLQSALEQLQRSFSTETIGILGVGSIGASTLRLLLSAMPHPRKIVLCDVYEKRNDLQKLASEVHDLYGYKNIEISAGGKGFAGSEIYECSSIIGATNAPEVLDVSRLPPGAIVVDDSAPHCFSVPAAWRRMESSGDVLFIEAGALTSANPLSEVRRTSSLVQGNQSVDNYLHAYDAHRIMGCVLSSVLLLDDDADLRPTIGVVELSNAEASWELLKKRGYTSGKFKLGEVAIPQSVLTGVEKFGCRGLFNAEA